METPSVFYPHHFDATKARFIVNIGLNMTAPSTNKVSHAADPDPIFDEGFVLLTDLRPIIPLHPQHIRKLVREGRFPAPVKLGGRTAFRRSDIRTWMAAQA
jgi:Helix-turn-helix domain